MSQEQEFFVFEQEKQLRKIMRLVFFTSHVKMAHHQFDEDSVTRNAGSSFMNIDQINIDQQSEEREIQLVPSLDYFSVLLFTLSLCSVGKSSKNQSK